MRELPILFSTPMVRAILDGNKTMTRRIVKPQPPDEAKTLCGPKTYEPIAIDKDGEMYPGSPIYGAYDENGEWGIKCPYQPGDHLYVRETWRRYSRSECTCYEYCQCPPDGTFLYFADWGPNESKWKPSIHMPKTAARIWLEVTNVRVERLQEITEEDARAEGCKVYEGGYVFPGTSYDKIGLCHGSPEMAFQVMWGELYPNSDTNPWVWVISFKKVTPCS